jgi:hypothetical protein
METQQEMLQRIARDNGGVIDRVQVRREQRQRNKAVRWDEPKGCTTPRGWCYIAGLSMTYDGQKPVGNYVTYPAVRGVRPRAAIHATAYVFRNTPAGYNTGATRHKWCSTVKAAKNWIERTAPTLA